VVKPFEVIFDRSVFHGKAFDQFLATPLERLVQSRAVIIHHAASFLEETLSLYEKEKNRREFTRQIPFLLRICNGNWLRNLQDIWQAELVLNRGPAARVSWKPSERSRAERLLWNMARHDASFPGFREALAEKDQIRAVQRKQRELFRALRVDVLRNTKALGVRRDPGYTFEMFLRREGEGLAREVIQRNFTSNSGVDLVGRWRAQPKRYPYLTTFLRGWAYCSYYAMVEQNKPLDTNAMVDVAQLTYLHEADVIVSADEKFQYAAFRAMWGEAKQFWTRDEFFTWLRAQ
jgi:hypothetical protein